jgi:hypothetical protein
MLKLNDSGATSSTDANPLLSFNWGGSATQLGYLGYGSSSNTALNLSNDVGEIQLLPSATLAATFTSTAATINVPTAITDGATTGSGYGVHSIWANPSTDPQIILGLIHAGVGGWGFSIDDDGDFLVGIGSGTSNGFSITPLTINGSGGVTIDSSSARHTIQSERTDNFGTLLVTNEDTSDASPGMAIVVGSSATTTANKLMNFVIDAGGAVGGAINMNGTGTIAFGTYSDARLKENVKDLPPQLDNILALRPVEFDYKAESPTGAGHQIGYIAQEMELVYPDALNYTGADTSQMKEITGWDKTSARLVKAIQELSAKLDASDARVNCLANADTKEQRIACF